MHSLTQTLANNSTSLFKKKSYAKTSNTILVHIIHTTSGTPKTNYKYMYTVPLPDLETSIGQYIELRKYD